MRLQEKIKADLTDAIKSKSEPRKNAIRVMMGEFSRTGSKSLTDAEVIGILKKLIKSERELIRQKGETEDSAFITIIEAYLPQSASADEIVAWIQSNIYFSQYKNKMQAMGPILKHFGAAADGNTVKALLSKLDM